MKERKYNIGDILENRYGDKYEIIDRGKKIKIKFLNTGYTKYSDSKEVSNGIIKDPLKPTIYDVGYIGEINKKYNKKDYIYIMSYSMWNKMIFRCYSPKSEIKNPTYKNVTVCEEWHNFQNFAKWYEENFPYHIKGIKFQLDKDLLQYNVDNKIYSPQTCVFLPDKVNSFLSIGYTTKIKSEHVGVNWHSRDNKYYVRCRDFLSNKVLNLGYYTNKEEAVKVYNKVKNKQINNVIEYLLNLNYLNPNLVYILENRKLGDEE